jgi:hypothetical protein
MPNGKGDKRRPCSVSREELDFRYEYGKATEKMPLKEFNRKIKEIRERTGRP